MRRPLKNRVPDEPMYVQVSTRPTLTHAHSTRHACPRGGHVDHDVRETARFALMSVRGASKALACDLCSSACACVMNSALSDRQRDELYVKSMILTTIQT